MSDSLVTNSAESTELRIRLITASVLLPIAILVSFVGGELFFALILPVMAIGMLEFYVMEKDTQTQGSSLTGIPTGIAVVSAFYLERNDVWQFALALCVTGTLLLEFARHPKQVGRALAQVGTTLCGVLYVAFPAAFMVSIRNQPEDGLIWVFLVFAITWGADTFGYIVGRLFGKKKLAPAISPNKTIEGAVGGIAGAWIAAFLLLILTDSLLPILIPMVAIAPLLAVGGDLFESAMKRFFRVKDSYVAGFNVFPGHGGVLDRIDALVWVASWVCLYLYVVGIL
jgi:phosphatidate cytidylyltransferase